MGEMLELNATPLIIMALLGTVGVSLPIVSIVKKGFGSNSLYAAVAFAALLASMAYVGVQFAGHYVTPEAALSKDVLVNDAFGGFFALALLIVSIFTTVGSFNYMRKHDAPAVYYSLILFSTIGMVLVAYSTDLVMLFVAWELMSIPTYILVGFAKKSPGSNEAALKYFLFGALSSAIIVYGISLSYGLTGSTNIADVVQGYASLDPSLYPLALLSVGLFIAGFGFKMGLVPFHQWLPDTYEGAPPAITALLAAATKKAGFAAAIRIIIMGTVALNVDWSLALGVLAVMTMTVGNVAAVMQKNIARMLAYSSIAHAGYILIGLAVAPHSHLGIQGSLYQILNHAVMKGAAFIAIAGLVTTLAVTHIDKLKGLGRRMPLTSLGLVISLFALAGVPPLAGFWSKLLLFGGALDASQTLSWAPWLAVAGVLNSALSLAYYGWLTRKMYFEGEGESRVKEPKMIVAIMMFSTVFLVGFGVYPEPILRLVEFAAPIIPIPITP